MAQVSFQFALIGRSYPCELFEGWSKVARKPRERRRASRIGERVSFHDYVLKRMPDSARS